MKHGYLLIVTAVLALLFYSCDTGELPYNPETDPSWGNFWAINIQSESLYRVDAVILASGPHCEIWVDKKSGVDKVTAENIRNEYEANIYREMIGTFDMGEDTYNGIPFNDTMDAADLMGDGNKKLCILLLDIRDGARNEYDSYVAGYFWGEDIMPDPDNPFSNGRDMIYVDTYPLMRYIDDFYGTIAHEMQHLMNFVTSQIKRKPDDKALAQLMEVWIDEGLAGAAEWVYSKKHSKQRLDWFSEDPYSTISQGNNFYVWDNYEGLVLDDYATAYLFFQWLRLQFSSDIYNKIITSEHSNYEAITSNANAPIYNNARGWETLMKEWLIANYVKAPNGGPYGYPEDPDYPDDSKLNELNVRAKTIPQEIQDDYKNKLSEYPLYPGEAVYSLIGTGNGITTMPIQSDKIHYATINRTTPENAGFAAGNTLLSFNVNTAQTMIKGDSTITGHANENDWSKDSTDTSRSMSGGQTFPGPFAVSAWDMIRMNKNKKNNSGNKPARVPRRLADE